MSVTPEESARIVASVEGHRWRSELEQEQARILRETLAGQDLPPHAMLRHKLGISPDEFDEERFNKLYDRTIRDPRFREAQEREREERCKAPRYNLTRQRRRLLLRDGPGCYICGVVLDRDGDYHVDHVVARAVGGTDEDWNLALTCQSCNIEKNDSAVAFEVATRRPIYHSVRSGTVRYAALGERQNRTHGTKSELCPDTECSQ